MWIDHIGIAVLNVESSKEFYFKALAPLDLTLIAEDQGWVGFGKGDKAEFWFGEDEIVHPPMHLAFAANNRADVDAYYTAAIDAGGVCNGKPGIREIYHLNYYSAFVIDPDGHNIEAVCHSAE